MVTNMRSLLEAEAGTRVADLHVWQLSERDAAAIISIVTKHPQPVSHYRNLLNGLSSLKHVTIEINLCEDEDGLPATNPPAGYH